MKRVVVPLVLALVLFGAAVVFGPTVAHAQCVNSFSHMVGGSCAVPGWNVFASVSSAGCTSPTAVTAEVYDSGGNLVETFSLSASGTTWSGTGVCINPNQAYRVVFVATSGQVDDTSGSAFGVNCGGC
jgi:hypothetical protein